ncbi:hypothetical protein CCAN12_290006 [Capnocytophaga canimorsus]|uniref:Uncharacterized protein n=1 Tax=Capnocytophaga canimorsus TaxID=28188 RepID=A0A0B7H5Q1_9FLAO|nr:hypothetical protein [Capnocytophaga canimorsus]CEN32963.1 hypothetical protein CCAN12_290006 [Capnocytophaga canimorsus]
MKIINSILGVSYEAGATDSSAEYENSDRLGFFSWSPHKLTTGLV